MNKTYGSPKNILLCLLLCSSLFSCGRFGRRIVEVHKIDTLVISQGRVVDSFFVFQKIRDTFKTDRFTIYRDSDHFRYYFRERNCTTYLSKTIIQPERIREKKEALPKRPFYKSLGFFEKAVMFLSFVALNLILLLYVFRRRS